MLKRASRFGLFVVVGAALVALGAALGPMVTFKAAAAALADRRPKKALRTPFSHGRKFSVTVVVDSANLNPTVGVAKYIPDDDPGNPIPWGKPINNPKTYKSNGNKRKLFLVFNAVGKSGRADGTGMITIDVEGGQVDDVCVEQVDPATFDINPCF
jgi:hypothetical protein